MSHAKRIALILGIVTLCGADGDGYRAEIERWRQRREAELKTDDGWLTLAGLAWIREGETSIGSDPSSDVLLPASAPATVGTLTLAANRASFRVEPGVDVTRDGRPFAGGEIRSDAQGRPDVLAVGPVRLILLKRGARYALRIKDNQGEARASFAGLRWFPIDESWKIVARFEAQPTTAKLVFDTIVGEQDVLESPGFVTFEREGKTYRLQAAAEGDRLWFVFRDATSGRTTQGSARQLLADPPRDGVVVLDFNKATNLPCAYTPYATCPLAPAQNRLGLAITAGEKKYEPGPRPSDGASGPR